MQKNAESRGPSSCPYFLASKSGCALAILKTNPKKPPDHNPASAAEGGLFGAVQLEPPRAESSVPPPAGAAGSVAAKREVPSIEEARAEFDRARASFAADSSEREADFDANSNSDAPPRETSVAQTSAKTRDAQTPEETVSFGAVTLPLLTPQTESAPRADEAAQLSAEPQSSALFASKSLFAPTQLEANADISSPQKSFVTPDLDAIASGANAPDLDASAERIRRFRVTRGLRARAAKRERSCPRLNKANCCRKFGP